MIYRNVGSQHIPFYLSDANGAAVTGATVTVKRVIDNSAQATAGGAVTEKALGQYVFSPTAADVDGENIGFLITSAGSVPLHLTVSTTPMTAEGAASLASAGLSMHRGSVTGAATTTTLIDTSLTQAHTDHWKGRVLIFVTGVLAKQATIIEGFNPSTDQLTFGALTAAPSAADQYVIV
jgi:hypothetical protein